jgi:hypothetical protein
MALCGMAVIQFHQQDLLLEVLQRNVQPKIAQRSAGGIDAFETVKHAERL